VTSSPDGGGPAPAEAGQPAPPPALRQHKIRRTRVGGVWAGLAIAAVVLVFLLIFILENGQSASIGYFGAHGHLPLGVALLLAAVGGALLVIIPGSGRMVQLRLAARRHRRLDARPAAQPPAVDDPASSPPQAPGPGSGEPA
jgi:uncharacterized integral membrane protein